MLTIYDPDASRYLKRILQFVVTNRNIIDRDLELEAAIIYMKRMLGEHV